MSRRRRSFGSAARAGVAARLGLAGLALLLLAGAAPAGEAPAASWDELQQCADGMKEAMFAQMGLGPGMVVAEIGAGKGWFALNAAEVVGPTGHVYATDIDPQTVDFLRRRIVYLPPSAARIEVRQCAGSRDTALDDLPAGSVDVITMIDSLCFDGTEPHASDVAYLRRLHRLLRPGGHFVHHMDCRCLVGSAELNALFADAGFGPPLAYRDIPQPPLADADWFCRTDEQRRRHALLAIFPKD